MIRRRRWVVLVAQLAVAVGGTSLFADEGRRSLADQYAPAGVMYAHMHAPGEWMLEYQYGNQYLEDNRIGDRSVSDAEAISYGATSHPVTNREATPTDMTAEMHRLNVMYGYHEDVTLYTTLTLPSLTMDHLRGPSNPVVGDPDFTTHSSGIGDTNLGVLLRIYSTECTDWIFNLGCSVPTGDIDRVTTEPTAGLALEPMSYPMRLGSGTFNARPGLTYRRYHDWWSWGAQVQADLPIGENDRDYSVGDEWRLNSWTSVLLADWWAVSYRSEHLFRSDYSGGDVGTLDSRVSTNVEDFRGGYWYSMGFGTQMLLGRDYFNCEVIPTIRQDLNGVQLETDFSFVASWSKTF